MRIPWIDALNERRRRKAEARREERFVERMVNSYDDFERGFAKSFGMPFSLAVRFAIIPYMRALVKDALPDLLSALADGDPAMTGSDDDPGTLVASLSRSTGAYWGPAPEGGGGGLVNSSFVAEAKVDPEDASHVEVKMLGGTVQGLFGAIQVFNTTYWTRNAQPVQLFDDYDEDTDDVLAGNIADGELFWLEYHPTANVGSRWTIEHGASLPHDAVSEDDEEVVNYFSYVSLFRVRLTQAGTGVVQEHYGAVCVPTATNVVDVQTVESGGGGEGGEGEGGEGE